MDGGDRARPADWRLRRAGKDGRVRGLRQEGGIGQIRFQGGDAGQEGDAEGGTVKIGVLHSLTGTMAISEISLRDAVLMAVEEINAAGGVLGKKIEPVVVDPASDWPMFAEKAKYLINQEHVAVTFGCWTSVSRKSVSAGLRGIQPIALLPRAVRRRRTVVERVLHRRGPEPAVDPGGGIHDEAGVQEVLSLGNRLRLPADRQQGAEGLSAGQGRA